MVLFFLLSVFFGLGPKKTDNDTSYVVGVLVGGLEGRSTSKNLLFRPRRRSRRHGRKTEICGAAKPPRTPPRCRRRRRAMRRLPKSASRPCSKQAGTTPARSAARRLAAQSRARSHRA